MNFRQVHLDFHTSGKIPGIGSKFSKEQFQDAVTVPACLAVIQFDIDDHIFSSIVSGLPQALYPSLLYHLGTAP